MKNEKIENEMVLYHFNNKISALNNPRIPITCKCLLIFLNEKLHLLNCIVACIFILTLVSVNASAQYQDKLAVINAKGEVLVRDVYKNSIGSGTKLNGPSLFGGANDQFVTNEMAVRTTSGEYWFRNFDDNNIYTASQLPGSLFGGSNAKYVFIGSGGCSNVVYVINNSGEAWAHSIDGPAIGQGIKLNGPSLFGGPNDKYVVWDNHDQGRILVINAQGEIWAHNLSHPTPAPNTFCTAFDAIGEGYILTGPNLFGAPNDEYIVSLSGRLLVINSLGEVWARDISSSSIGTGYKLTGPSLFGTPNDTRYVIGFTYSQPPK